MDRNIEANGLREDFSILSQRAVDCVIPRLIGALETKDRKVKPCLIHGNLWEGNTRTAFENGNIYTFDSAAFYAHNEWKSATGDVITTKSITWCILALICITLQSASTWMNGMTGIACIPYITMLFTVNHRSNGTAVRQM